MKTLEDLIESVEKSLFDQNSTEIILYNYLNKNSNSITDVNSFDGEVESISYASFQDSFVNLKILEKVQKKVNNQQYEKSINIFNWIGLALQERLQDNGSIFFKNKLNEKFKKHSIRHKYLISKFFKEYIEKLIELLKSEIDNKTYFVLILKYIYLEENININDTLKNFQKEDDYDIIDLLLLEDLRDIKTISYDKTKKKLFDDILWILTEVQSNHKNYNNSEDQYNSIVRSLLTAKDYKVQDQTQRGQSSTGKSTGELDIAIFTNTDMQLSIFEAFILNGFDSDVIKKHLLKLSKNYDPSGVKQNYAVVYVKSVGFSSLWDKYKDFVVTIDFDYKIINSEFKDITSQYPNYASLRIGQTKHKNRGVETVLYHFFLDMNF